MIELDELPIIEVDKNALSLYVPYTLAKNELGEWVLIRMKLIRE